MRLLYLCDADTGGIAEYAVHQVEALAKAGAEVTFLCRPSFDTERLNGLSVSALLPFSVEDYALLPLRLARRVADARAIAQIAVHQAVGGNYHVLLIACYAEYFSPFWATIYQRAARNGLTMGTIAHDPVRDFMVGPPWWHRWSVRQAYSFISYAFVHDNTPVDFGGPKPRNLQVHVIPCGSFQTPLPSRTRESIRTDYDFAREDIVFLAFGQIRDGKNLDRFLRAMVQLPAEVKLLVAGASAGGSQKSPESYVQMAEALGVANRCRWDLRYIPDEETGDLFAAADVILMIYSARFRSASGVLNTAVASRKPVLASSGAGPLRTLVAEYGIGVFVPPDNDEAILQGTRAVLETKMVPEWDRYEVENSWGENAKGVIKAFFS